jgi:hypothetical protein
VEALLERDFGKMVGNVGGEIVRTPLPDTWTKKKRLDLKLYELARVLAS